MLTAYQKHAEPPTPAPLRTLIQKLLQSSQGAQPSTKSPAGSIPARFDWSEYERLIISEALLRGNNVFNIALRVDPNSAMHAAAFQLIRTVLHTCGTVIALHPQDNLAAASVAILHAS